MISFLLKFLVTFVLCFATMTFMEDRASYAPKPCHASVRHIEGNGIGYTQGYTTLEGFFAPRPKVLMLMPFLDLRGHVFNKGKMAANAGVGLRKITESRVYGFNVYYDYRNTQKMHYNQIGFGFETLGEQWDFQINGYLPIGRKITSFCYTKFAECSDHQTILVQKYQFAMKGIDAQLGFHLGKYRFFDFYISAGPYYYRGEKETEAWGGQGSLTCRFNDYFAIELSDAYDTFFHNGFQCQLTLTLPFGRSSKVKETDTRNSTGASNALLSKMIQSTVRDEIIVVGQKKIGT